MKAKETNLANTLSNQPFRDVFRVPRAYQRKTSVFQDDGLYHYLTLGNIPKQINTASFAHNPSVIHTTFYHLSFMLGANNYGIRNHSQ